MIVLLDLDGTLINTTAERFRAMRDGQTTTVVSEIPIIPGAGSFVLELQSLGHTPIIISDSHPTYVHPIVRHFFNVPCLDLASKPNVGKVRDFLGTLGHEINGNNENFIVVGDTWLDVEMGRCLRVKTVLTQFVPPEEVTHTDSIGKGWQHQKSGPTFVVKSFPEILSIIENPTEQLLAAEAAFLRVQSHNAFRLRTTKENGQWTIFRSLGRQSEGESDPFSIEVYYKEFHRADRTHDTLQTLATAVSGFISYVCSQNVTNWDLLTYVTDKATTTPPNKLLELFNLVQTDVPRAEVFGWSLHVDGSIRNRATFGDRRSFVEGHLHVNDTIDLRGKSIIVIDDQFTTGGTAYEVTRMLREKGALNILFITMFFMTSTVSSERLCSRCGRRMNIKIRKADGHKFLSCTPPQFRGTGCGHIENITQ